LGGGGGRQQRLRGRAELVAVRRAHQHGVRIDTGHLDAQLVGAGGGGERDERAEREPEGGSQSLHRAASTPSGSVGSSGWSGWRTLSTNSCTLSFASMPLWSRSESPPGAAHSHACGALRLSGALSPAALSRYLRVALSVGTVPSPGPISVSYSCTTSTKTLPMLPSADASRPVVTAAA